MNNNYYEGIEGGDSVFTIESAKLKVGKGALRENWLRCQIFKY